MKLLLLSNYFPPEIGSGPHLPYELGETLVRNGHQVSVVTGFPRYNVPSLPDQYRAKQFYCETMAGMEVFRVRAPIPYGNTKLSRGLFHLLMPSLLTLRSLPLKPPDLVYTITPPLITGLTAKAVAARFRVPCVVNVQDLFPQNAIDLGLLRNSAAIRALELLERSVYRLSDAITVMSDGNREHVISKGTPRGKVHTVFNWVDTELIQPGERSNIFRTDHGLGDAFIVLFAGTMGWSQGLETVIEAARQLTAEPNLFFLMVGGGVERTRLETQASDVANVRFLPMQPKEVYPQVLAAADACLVTLRPQVLTPTVPSKMATIMAAGRPVLASLPPGDASRLVQEAQCGIVTPAGSASTLAQAVLQLKHDRAFARQLGINGRRYAERQLSRDVGVSRLERLFEGMLNGCSPKVAC